MGPLVRYCVVCFKVISIDSKLFMLFSSVVFFSLESLKKLESDYRNNLRKLQGNDREVNVYWNYVACLLLLDNKL